MQALTLVIGNKSYSSSSLRPWLLMREREIPFQEVLIPLHRPDSLARKLQYSPSGKVPVLLDGERRIWESLAIVEYLAERFPEKQLWPRAIEVRAHARCAVSELLTGFAGLWSSMPFYCRAHLAVKEAGAEVEADVDRIQALWADCRRRYGGDGGFLFGEFCAADAMFAHVVLRFRSYGVDLAPISASYAEQVLALESVREWLLEAQVEPWVVPEYEA